MQASQISKQISDQMRNAVKNAFGKSEISDVIEAFISSKEKKGLLFGQLSYLHFRMFGGNSEDIYKVAAAVELMILALDIFDDLQDQDAGNQPWSQYPAALSMNTAIGILSVSVSPLQQMDLSSKLKLKLIHRLQKQISSAVLGQYVDLKNELQHEDDYFLMIKQKSGSLLSCACLLGTQLATGIGNPIVKEYAEYLGEIAQIQNDIKDILRWDEKSDFLVRKRTLPILFLLNRTDSSYSLISDYYSSKIDKKDILKHKTTILQLIEKSGALEYASVHCRIRQLKAFDLIDQLQVAEEWKVKLKTFF